MQFRMIALWLGALFVFIEASENRLVPLKSDIDSIKEASVGPRRKPPPKPAHPPKKQKKNESKD